MSIKFPILSINFQDDTPLEYVQQWFDKHPDLTMKYRHMGYKYSQIKSYYESPLSLTISEPDAPYLITATLNIKKHEMRLHKCLPRGALIKTGRPPKKALFTEEPLPQTE